MKTDTEAGASKVIWIAPPWAWRSRRTRDIEPPLMLALLLWLCALPLVLLLLAPFFGLNTALGAAAVLLIAILLVCFGICMPEEPRTR